MTYFNVDIENNGKYLNIYVKMVMKILFHAFL